MGTLNSEQQELFFNNWTCVMQPCMVRMGNGAITEPMLEAFVDQAVLVFQRSQRVTSGGMFILHGLIATVENRILPYIPKFIDYISCALKMESCDDMSTRLAAGLISDLSNSIGNEIC